jgi:hypothetical protein
MVSLRNEWFFRFLFGMIAFIIGIHLATLNSRSKNVSIEAIIIAEFKFCDQQRHVLADLVERADDAALEDAPVRSP